MVEDARCQFKSTSVCYLTTREARQRRGKVAVREVRSFSREKLTLGDVDCEVDFTHSRLASANATPQWYRLPRHCLFCVSRLPFSCSESKHIRHSTINMGAPLFTSHWVSSLRCNSSSCNCAPLILLSLPSTSFSGNRLSFPVHIRTMSARKPHKVHII